LQQPESKMRPNAIRSGVQRGEALFGTWLTLIHNPSILMLLKSAGLDYVRVDMEHSSITIESIADMAVVARALDFPIVVRPPRANREWITRLLDVGVWNIHCPQVESKEHAAEIVAASRYAPRGFRGAASLSIATEFERAGTAIARRAFANDQVFITVMLETGRAFDDLEAIAAMDGIDALTVGPTDLAQDIGVFGKPEQSAALDQKRDLILAAAKRHDKTCAMLVSSAAEAKKWKDAGALLLAYSSDAEMLLSGFSRAITALKE
jgi:2-keto-3-deoxy-L-rhamnonate aldolase RhmA